MDVKYKKGGEEKVYKRFLFCVLLLIFLYGCGGDVSGSSGGSSGNNSNSNSNWDQMNWEQGTWG
jgi:hypothetical protein